MQKSPYFFQSAAIVVLLALPVAAMWMVQQRAASRHKHNDPVPPENADALALGFVGFPYVHLPVSAVDATHALDTFQALVKKQERELGPDHPSTLLSRNNLANALLAQGRLTEAEVAERALLADMERVLDADHPDIFRCRFNLALNLRSQGKLDAARKEMEIVYEGWRRVLGEGHPRTQEALLVLERLRPQL